LFQPLLGFSDLGAHDALDGGTGALHAMGLHPVAATGEVASSGQASAGAQELTRALERVVAHSKAPCALVIDFASRLMARTSDLTPTENQLFTRALMLSHQARARPFGPQRRPFFNTVIWIVEREGDLPDWFLVGNPRVRHIPVGKPDQATRRALAPALLRPLSGSPSATAVTVAGDAPEAMRSEGHSPDALRKAQDAFVEGTDGMLLLDMNAIAVLARVEGVTLEKVADAVRRYKVGVTEDPWHKIDRNRIRGAEAFVRQRVKGQDAAIVHMLDLVKRAMTGVGGGRRGNRPRGVAFLAGPTGVGKTELAKTITSLLFGDEGAYIRFDMSEFSAEHADQRLVGAPPGYIGYDAGGELTNAIRDKPFSVVLFDEIEKAHPRVLDKFLQILDDGVLTSGRGDRVYFSEALIVFTSNLGIDRTNEAGARVLNVSSSQPYEEVSAKVQAEIDQHFKLVLNRPEILNRIGENIIVFDFIRENVAQQIFEQMVEATLGDLHAQDLGVELAPPAREALHTLCLADLSNGGRGIRNQLEAYLLNPLARTLFDIDARPGQRFRVEQLGPAGLQLVPITESM